MQSTIPFITAIGQSQVWPMQHKDHVNGIVTLANPPGTATCVCDLGKEGKVCEHDGTGCGTFTKNCVAEPNGSLLFQRNPTCNSIQYGVPSRSISPPWGSIRFRLALRAYAPWGVRVVSQTKSRKIPTRNILPLFFVL